MPAPRLTTYQTKDSTSLAVRIWRSAGKSTSKVIFLHGIISHGGWYGASCTHLANTGCEVHFLERRGSGLNDVERGDVDHWQTWIDDVEVYLEQLGDDLPRILCGISWGGKLAAAVACQRPNLVDGLGLICPGIYAFQQPSVGKRLALTILGQGRFCRRRVKIPLEDPQLFTNSPTHQAYIGQDPLALREITLRFARHDLKLTAYAREAGAQLGMPLLLVLAGEDLIVRREETIGYFADIASRKKTICEYPDAAHTLEFEPNPEEYLSNLVTWIHGISNRSENQ